MTTETTTKDHECSPADHCGACHIDATIQLIRMRDRFTELGMARPLRSVKAALAEPGCRCGCD